MTKQKAPAIMRKTPTKTSHVCYGCGEPWRPCVTCGDCAENGFVKVLRW
jgi:hypothetical protein